MSDALDDVLDRHRRIWAERLYKVAVLGMVAGLSIGYLVRWWWG